MLPFVDCALNLSYLKYDSRLSGGKKIDLESTYSTVLGTSGFPAPLHTSWLTVWRNVMLRTFIWTQKYAIYNNNNNNYNNNNNNNNNNVLVICEMTVHKRLIKEPANIE
jgi:hypothetical protein